MLEVPLEDGRKHLEDHLWSPFSPSEEGAPASLNIIRASTFRLIPDPWTDSPLFPLAATRTGRLYGLRASSMESATAL